MSIYHCACYFVRPLYVADVDAGRATARNAACYKAAVYAAWPVP